MRNSKLMSWERTGSRRGMFITLQSKLDDGGGKEELLSREPICVARRGRYMLGDGLVSVPFFVGDGDSWSSTGRFGEGSWDTNDIANTLYNRRDG